METSPPIRPGIAELSGAFLKLGLTSFGGPIAHLGYLHSEFVQRRRWISDADYADLVALCQFLPGPASTQVVFGLGRARAGLRGGLAASICFLLPSAAIMIALGHGLTTFGAVEHAGWIHGLKLAAVPVVAQAVWSMGRKLCPDVPRFLVALLAAAVLVLTGGAWIQVGVIAAGAVAGWMMFRHNAQPVARPEPTPQHHRAAVMALLVFGLLLFVPSVIARLTQSRDAAVFDSFYRSGALVFGGGHVVLPLLRAEVVPRGWITDNAFLAGYGAAQAVPGPLFSFAGYLGAIIYDGPHWWLGGLWCVLAIFLPAWLLVGGAIPFWHRLRAMASAQAAIQGANAAVVGVLLAALYSPVMTEGIQLPLDVAIAVVSFVLLQSRRTPPLAVVALCALSGWWFAR